MQNNNISTHISKKAINNKLTGFDSLQAWLVIFSAALFFLYAFINMTCFNGLNPQLMQAFKVSALSISQLSAMYFYANILFLIPAGILLDKFSPRRLILIIMPISVISTFIFSSTHDYHIACIMRFIMGATSTFCLLSAAKLTSQWLSPKFAARAISLVVTIAMIGGVLAQQLPNLMPANSNWQDLLKVISALGLGLYLIIFLTIKDMPNNNPNKKSNISHQTQNTKTGWLFALKNNQNYLLGFLTNFLSTPIMILGALWGVGYLTEVKGLSTHNAQLCCSLLFIGMIVGSPFFGWISDFLKSRKKPIIFGILGSIITITLIMTDHYQTNIFMPVLLFMLGFFTACQVISYAIIIEVNPPEYCAFSESIASTIIMSSGAIFQPLFGYLLTQGAFHNYKLAMLIFPVVFVLCLIICFWIKESA
jgi:MFS family permease